MAIYFRDIFFSFLLESTLTVSNFSPSDSLPVSLMQPPQEPRLLGFVSKRREGELCFLIRFLGSGNSLKTNKQTKKTA